jgi:hypothetical protein
MIKKLIYMYNLWQNYKKYSSNSKRKIAGNVKLLIDVRQEIQYGDGEVNHLPGM